MCCIGRGSDVWKMCDEVSPSVLFKGKAFLSIVRDVGDERPDAIRVKVHVVDVCCGDSPNAVDDGVVFVCYRRSEGEL